MRNFQSQKKNTSIKTMQLLDILQGASRQK